MTRKTSLSSVGSAASHRSSPAAHAATGKRKQKMDAGEENISVSVRVRPLNARERKAINEGTVRAKEMWTPSCSDAKIALVKIDPATGAFDCSKDASIVGQPYTFDNVFGPNNDTQAVYDRVARRVVSSIYWHKWHYMYGGRSGKTHTMQGSKSHPGILRLAAHILRTSKASLARVHRPCPT